MKILCQSPRTGAFAMTMDDPVVTHRHSMEHRKMRCDRGARMIDDLWNVMV